jgi:hypothetical protein
VYKFEITPYKSVGEIAFENPREAVRKLLGEYKEFKKSKFSKNTTDDFKFCHVFYDENDKVNAIEFFTEIELLLKNKNILAMNFNSLLQFVKESSYSYTEDDTGAIVNDIGIAIYAPDKNRVESILVYKKGYYD